MLQTHQGCLLSQQYLIKQLLNHDLVTVLSDTAERADNLDESEAIKAKEAAEQELANKDATLDYAKAASQLAEAVARLKTIQKLRKKQ